MTVKVAVLGVGVMGANHADQLTNLVAGADVTVINDYDDERANAIADAIPGARVVSDPFDAIVAEDVDAVVIATPGPVHEKQVLACLEAGKPVLCEKPLTTDVESSLEIVKAEAALGKQLIQIGFMRRFDDEYMKLRALVESGELGAPIMLHLAHRNPAVPDHFDSAMIVKDCLVHEVDCARFLLGEEIKSVHILKPRPNSNARDGLQDPQFAIFEMESGRMVDAEAFVTTGIAYEVRSEAIFERGSAQIGLDVNLVRKSAPGIWGGTVTPGFKERFGRAYHDQLQRWVNAVKRGDETGNYVDGPRAWDGYAAAAVCDAGVRSLTTSTRVEVDMVDRASIPGA
ncbi:Gfo/Idh/MocA family oxidoreductase [Hoyosella subflava]|uniref:Inositol 2-dehydrogenase n=1 Tax=Hoyosella subflava (strain DSM 45089 / JCM 17490 / NBRC 109087 / DQS3-9A1) TaxID=443218 RepID=F6EHP3_HOYSD|nr:Gfo/Idh/MocA family oxidoreductase [Hoyosella subflava]AEF42407.1 Inositol 2-dehydrogenase [Hoyosella subflava DQS3-9A1]